MLPNGESTGVGISHADVGDLQEFVKWVASTNVVPATQKEALLRLTEAKYQHAAEGIQYDELRAAGLCMQLKGQTVKDLWENPSTTLPRARSTVTNVATTRLIPMIGLCSAPGYAPPFEHRMRRRTFCGFVREILG